MKAHILGIALLRERGVRLLSATEGQDLTEDTDEMTEGMVTIMAVFSQIEKKRLVKKLRAARDRKSLQQRRRIEGRRSYGEINPELVRTIVWGGLMEIRFANITFPAVILLSIIESGR
jgi:DNA invertase Pin-like site-specific DNA recombinase